MSVTSLVNLAVARGIGIPEQAKRWQVAPPPPPAAPGAPPAAPVAAEAPAAPGMPGVAVAAAPAAAEAGPQAAPAAAAEQKPATGLSVIISAVPVEIVAAYTAIAALMAPSSTPSTDFLDQYKAIHGTAFPYGQTMELIAWRWAAFAAFALFTIGVVFKGWKAASDPKDKRKAPVSELLAAFVAFVVWSLTMPAGLLTPYIGTSSLLVKTGVIIGIAAFFLGLLGHTVLKNPAKQPNGAAAQAGGVAAGG